MTPEPALTEEQKAAWRAYFAGSGIPIHPAQARAIGFDVPEVEVSVEDRARIAAAFADAGTDPRRGILGLVPEVFAARVTPDVPPSASGPYALPTTPVEDSSDGTI